MKLDDIRDPKVRAVAERLVRDTGKPLHAWMMSPDELTVVVVVVVGGHAYAEKVIVKGSADCGAWIKARTEHASALLEAYFFGALNGLAMGADVEFWHANGTDVTAEAVFLWLDGWCRQHPLDYVLSGASAPYREHSGWQPALP